MARIKQDFEIFAGEDKQINFTITDDAGDPVDLTDSEAVWVLVRLASDQQNLIVKRVSTGGIIINANVYEVLLDDVDSDQLKGKYNHELRMVKDGVETVLAIGTGQVYNSLTKDL